MLLPDAAVDTPGYAVRNVRTMLHAISLNQKQAQRLTLIALVERELQHSSIPLPLGTIETAAHGLGQDV
eukprot:6214406-Pleurochrysis_carterae.AAC.3